MPVCFKESPARIRVFYVLNNKTWNAASYGEQKIEPNIVNLLAFLINHSKNYNNDTKKHDKIKIVYMQCGRQVFSTGQGLLLGKEQILSVM